MSQWSQKVHRGRNPQLEGSPRRTALSAAQREGSFTDRPTRIVMDTGGGGREGRDGEGGGAEARTGAVRDEQCATRFCG